MIPEQVTFRVIYYFHSVTLKVLSVLRTQDFINIKNSDRNFGLIGKVIDYFYYEMLPILLLM